MTPALRYLIGHSFVNGVVARVKRLRQPKYLFAALIGAAYFYFYFYRFLFGGLGGPGRNGGMPLLTDASWQSLGAAMLLVALLVFSWILPASRAAITFTEAEIAFLFPAPIPRRTLVIHKLLKSQIAFLIIASMITLITGRFRAGGEAWFRLIGWVIILNTLSMHRIGASFALQRLREWGMADGKRRLALLLVLGALVFVEEGTRRALPPLPQLLFSQGHAGPDFNGLIGQIAHAGPMPYVLAPFRWVMAPYFSHHFDAFVVALGPAVLFMALHFYWVIRADISFEEASIVASQKRASIIAAQRKGEFRLRSPKARTPVWRLGTTGFAPLAFLWRSLIKFGGRRALLLWALFFTTLGVGAAGIGQFRGHPLPGWVITLAFIVGGGCYATVLITFVMVGQSASAQLRQGMASMDLVKTFPIPGWQLALGELSGPILLGTLLQWCALGTAAILASSLIPNEGAGSIIAFSAIGLGVLLPAFNISMSILPSGAALLFPAWFKPQEASTHGLEATGMRLLIGIAQLAAMAGMLLPVAFFGCCTWFIVGKFTASFLWQASLAGGVGAVVLAMESALGVVWLGSLYDSYDTANA